MASSMLPVYDPSVSSFPFFPNGIHDPFHQQANQGGHPFLPSRPPMTPQHDLKRTVLRRRSSSSFSGSKASSSPSRSLFKKPSINFGSPRQVSNDGSGTNGGAHWPRDGTRKPKGKKENPSKLLADLWAEPKKERTLEVSSSRSN